MLNVQARAQFCILTVGVLWFTRGFIMLLTEDEIDGALRGLPEWTRAERSISASYQFAGFPGAMAFVNHVAGMAERANHHPDIDIRWNKVLIRLSTHSDGGLTDKDFALAEQIDRLD